MPQKGARISNFLLAENESTASARMLRCPKSRWRFLSMYCMMGCPRYEDRLSKSFFLSGRDTRGSNELKTLSSSTCQTFNDHDKIAVCRTIQIFLKMNA